MPVAVTQGQFGKGKLPVDRLCSFHYDTAAEKAHHAVLGLHPLAAGIPAAGDDQSDAEPQTQPVAFPWYPVVGGTMAFVFGYLLGDPVSRREDREPATP